MDAFLTHTQIKKIALLKYLALDSSVTTQNLATVWGVSRKSINRYCDSLQEDFDYYLPDSQVSLKNKQGKISLILTKNISYSYLKDSLTLAYIQESIKVNIIDSLLTNKFKNVVDLSETLHLTPTTVYTHLYQLEELLKIFEMSFKWTSPSQSLNFVYEEKKIRYFSYLFYWKFFKGYSPIIQTNTFDYQTQFDLIKKFVSSDISQLTLHQFCYIAQVTRWHLHQNNPVTLTKESIETLKVMVGVIDYSEVIIENNSPLLESERLFFNLQVQLLVTSLENGNIREKKVRQLEEKKTYLFDYCNTIFKRLCSELKLTPSKMDRIYFIYNMVSLTIYNNELGIPVNNPFMNDFDLVFHTTNQQLEDGMLSCITNIFHEVSHQYNQVIKNENLAQLIMIMLINKSKEQSYMTIYINFSANPMGNIRISNQLLKVFNPEKIVFSPNINTADLIISDNALLYNGQHSFFFIDDLNDPLYLSNLFDVVQKKLVNLIFDSN